MRRAATERPSRLSASRSGRYTAPEPAARAPSPWWVPVLLIGLIVAGIVIVMVGYWGSHGGLRLGLLAVGAACVLGGFFTATRYH